MSDAHIYTFTDHRGISHDITQKDIEHSFRVLRSAGYDFHEANDKALDYIIARLTIDATHESDLVYGAHSFQKEDKLCSDVATRLSQIHLQKETTHE
jgi:hypothetical protein